jgi:hypothetical protein
MSTANVAHDEAYCRIEACHLQALAHKLLGLSDVCSQVAESSVADDGVSTAAMFAFLADATSHLYDELVAFDPKKIRPYTLIDAATGEAM